MKKKKKWIVVLGVVLLLLFSVLGILRMGMSSEKQTIDNLGAEGGSSNGVAFDMNQDSSSSTGSTGSGQTGESTETTESTEGSENRTQVSAPERMLIRTANYSIQTEDFLGARDAIHAIADANAGYFTEESVSNYVDYGQMVGDVTADDVNFRQAEMVLKIPSEKFETVLDALEGAEQFQVLSSSMDASDVTDAYRDAQVRLENAKASLTRYQELLNKAETIDDMNAVIAEMTDLEYEIDSIESQMQAYDDGSSYSTIVIELKEVKEILPTPEEDPSYWEQFKETFIKGWNSFVDALKAVSLWFAGSWIWLVLLVVVICLVRKSYRKHKAERIVDNSVDNVDNSADSADSSKEEDDV